MILRPPTSPLVIFAVFFRFFFNDTATAEIYPLSLHDALPILHRFFLHQISLESKLNGRQKVKGGHGSITASISTSIIASVIASIITLNLGVGCAPSCWPIFGFRNLLGAPRGRRGQFSVPSDNRFSGRGGGVGSLPRAWRRVGVPSPGRGGELGCQAWTRALETCELM